MLFLAIAGSLVQALSREVLLLLSNQQDWITAADVAKALQFRSANYGGNLLRRLLAAELAARETLELEKGPGRPIYRYRISEEGRKLVSALQLPESDDEHIIIFPHKLPSRTQFPYEFGKTHYTLESVRSEMNELLFLIMKTDESRDILKKQAELRLKSIIDMITQAPVAQDMKVMEVSANFEANAKGRGYVGTPHMLLECVVNYLDDSKNVTTPNAKIGMSFHFPAFQEDGILNLSRLAKETEAIHSCFSLNFDEKVPSYLRGEPINIHTMFPIKLLSHIMYRFVKMSNLDQSNLDYREIRAKTDVTSYLPVTHSARSASPNQLLECYFYTYTSSKNSVLMMYSFNSEVGEITPNIVRVIEEATFLDSPDELIPYLIRIPNTGCFPLSGTLDLNIYAFFETITKLLEQYYVPTMNIRNRRRHILPFFTSRQRRFHQFERKDESEEVTPLITQTNLDGQ